MGWGDVAAAVGGGLHGAEGAYRWQKDFELQQRKQEIQQQIAELRAYVQEHLGTQRADTADKDRATKKDLADAERTRKADEARGKLDLGYTVEGGRNERFQGSDATKNRAIDEQSGQFWGGTMPFRYDALETGDATRQRGQNIGAATSRYRTDATVGAEDRRTNATADAARGRTRSGSILTLLNMKARQKPGMFGTSAPASNFADEFDRLYKDPDFLASQLADATDDQSADQPTADQAPPPAPATPMSRLTPKGGPPAAAAAAAPKPGAAPSGVTAGATVTLKDGRRVTITKVNPDGTFEYR